MKKFERKKEVTNLKGKKSPSPSDLPAWALRDGCKVKYPHLTFLANAFMKYNLFQTRLKKAIVTPIFKKDDPEKADNYRPNSITGVIPTVFEKILQKQINEYPLSKNLLSNIQFGFRTSCSTMDATLYCTEFFRKTMDINKHFAVS